MPLSEDEERILQEISQQFYEDDPDFAGKVGETTLYSHTVRRMKWSGFGFVAGIAFLVASLSTSFLLAFAGFLMMLGCALYFERNLRKLGKAGLDHVTRSIKATGFRDAIGGAKGRMRERFRNVDDE
ncbi:MAG: DUF3040 domain-containing protein [Acidimicrobiales bacterium]